ncbi:MAG: sensor histidine kinase [Flavobacteriia bacterium]|nr:sensor histidine kinase [Flavobacteriia bacterium]
MKLRTLQILLYCCIYTLHGFSQADTNAVNTWNQEALDLAYSQPKRAMKIAEKALVESRRLNFARGEVRALIRMGIIYDVQSKNDQAIDMYEQSLQLAKKTKDQKAIASNLNNLGLIYWKNSELTKALTYLNRAYALFGVLEDEYNMASAANNLGLIYEEMELHDKALSWSRKGLTHAKLANDADLQYDIYSNMGNVFQSIGQQDSSGIYSRKAIEGYRKNGNKYGLGISLCNLAISLKNDGAGKESIPLLLESMALAKEIGHEHSYVSSGINLSQTYFNLKQFDKEREVLLKIYPEMLQLKSNELGYKVCYALGKNSYHFGDQEAARTYLEQYENFHAAYFKGIITKNLAEAEKKFQVRAERQQSALKLKEQEHARFIDNLIWGAVLVVFVFAGLLTFFIIRKRNLQRELINQRSVFEATIEERKRISYDLHDHVGSQLSYVVNNLELIQYSDQANERVKRTFTMSQAAMNSLRDTVWALHSEELTMGALTERMENLARKMLENTTEIELLFVSSVPADLVIPQHYTMHIMRVFQEAIHNVYKHAQATVLKITITETAGEIRITVSDNGIGIGDDPQKPFHYGLQSMKERATKINGTLTIQPNADGGTTVELRWSKTIPH